MSYSFQQLPLAGLCYNKLGINFRDSPDWIILLPLLPLLPLLQHQGLIKLFFYD
jgi:hypothetical protein